jgi:hypothetical protein
VQFVYLTNSSSLRANSSGVAWNMVVDAGASLSSNSSSLIGRSLALIIGGSLAAQVGPCTLGLCLFAVVVLSSWNGVECFG